jgi:glutamate--cysteine ligase
VQDAALTPSARMLAELEKTGESFFDLGLRMSRLHKEYFLALYPPNVERQAEFRAAADESLRAQKAVEAADKVGFEEYLAQYSSE